MLFIKSIVDFRSNRYKGFLNLFFFKKSKYNWMYNDFIMVSSLNPLY